MSRHHKDALRENLQTIADSMSKTEIEKVLAGLVSAKCLIEDEAESIMLSHNTPFNQANALVILLIKKSEKAFSTFVQLLWDHGQGRLARILQPRGNEGRYNVHTDCL